MSVWGYIRVSSRDQNKAGQLIALKEAGVGEKKMSVKQAAAACNMPVSSFFDKARQFEKEKQANSSQKL